MTSGQPSGPGEENRMAFLFRLETEDGKPADPPTLTAAVGPDSALGSPAGPRD
jgi:hypothetical protein